jgi:threonine dehydratase
LGSEIAAAINESGSNSNAVVVACGGGGLAAGVTLALRSISADVYVVEPETHARYTRSRARGAPISIDPTGHTSCDALRSRRVGARAFEILEQSNVRLCAINDKLVGDASRLLREICGIRVEPSGAIALGAVLGGFVANEYTRTWVIACGGNTGPES